MSDHIAISVQGVSKAYRIWNSPASRILSPAWKAVGDLFTENSTLARKLHNKATRHYRDFWALKDISFEVKKGESVGIIGCNGSGKSTLLQIIAGTLQPTTGSVKVNGRVAALLELGSGFNPEFTGRENVYLNGAVLGLSRSEVTARFDVIAAFADIGNFIEQPVKTYSSGMTMRLAFAVQTAVDPGILIIDEALSVGDEVFQRKCFRRIENLRARGTSLLFVSHDASSVIRLCNRGVLLRAGSIFVQGPPKAVVTVYHKSSLDSATQDTELLADFRRLSATSSEAPPPVGQASAPKMPVPNSDDESFFDASLISRNTVTYTSRGATITDPRIETIQGRRVNNLVHGRNYVYVYRVDFNTAAISVQFGSLIKSIEGHEIGGMLSHPHHQRSLCVFENDSYEIRLYFTCHLCRGSYAINCGVLAQIGQKDVYLHRIIDAVFFRVIPDPLSQNSGYVGFTYQVDLRKIDPSSLPLHATV